MIWLGPRYIVILEIISGSNNDLVMIETGTWNGCIKVFVPRGITDILHLGLWSLMPLHYYVFFCSQGFTQMINLQKIGENFYTSKWEGSESFFFSHLLELLCSSKCIYVIVICHCRMAIHSTWCNFLCTGN